MSLWESVGVVKDYKDRVEKYRKLLENVKEKPAHTVPRNSIEKLNREDILIVVDCQNDFIPPDTLVPGCGAFGVAYGDSVCKVAAKLIDQASEVGATIVATRDYHPLGHCSFNTFGVGDHKGPFPPHCVQGSKGAEFAPPIAEALNRAIARHRNHTLIAFKGYAEFIDSFGGFPYPEAPATRERVRNTDPSDAEPNYDPSILASVALGKEGGHMPQQCSTLDWTGATILTSSLQYRDVNAPPDVMAILNKNHKTLLKQLKPGRRVLVCGLALDYCVLDTCVNAASLPGTPFKYIYLLYDAAAAAHISGIGQFADGYLQDPQFVAAQLTNNKIVLASAEDVL